MKAIEIITIVVAVAIVVAVVAAWLVRKVKGKSSGCSGCAGCPYAGNCAHSAANSCTNHVDATVGKENDGVCETKNRDGADTAEAE